jgi:hypothetical protein
MKCFSPKKPIARRAIAVWHADQSRAVPILTKIKPARVSSDILYTYQPTNQPKVSK